MVNKEFEEIVSEIKKTGKPKKMTIRDFLWLFDYSQKRTSGNVWRINEYLKRENLITQPSYQYGWIDDKIELMEKEKAQIKKGDSSSKDFDPVSRISTLQAVNKIPISVKKEDTIQKAYHLMWENNFSQLPVMNNEYNVLGVITWQTIAKGFITKKGSDLVKDFMSNEFSILTINTPMFEAIKEVIKTEVIFIRDNENRIKGPITTSDLNEEFLEQIEPFILLEQIENNIRLILHNKITLEDLQESLNIRDGRKIESISDLTFGEYKIIIENEKFWNALDLPFDRKTFVDCLEKIRLIRNSIMHFHLDKNTDEDIEELNTLRKVSNFLQDYYSYKINS